MNGIDGLCFSSENRNNYGGYETNGRAARGASFKNDFDIFKSYKESDKYDYNKCNPKTFLDGAIGGKKHNYGGSDREFGGGADSDCEGGGSGYIGELISRQDYDNKDPNKYWTYGALSYICQDENIVENVFNVTQNNNMMISGINNDNGNLFKKEIDDYNLASIMASDEIESFVSNFSENHVSAKHFFNFNGDIEQFVQFGLIVHGFEYDSKSIIYETNSHMANENGDIDDDGKDIRNSIVLDKQKRNPFDGNGNDEDNDDDLEEEKKNGCD